MNRLRAHSGPLWPYVVLVAIPTAAFVLPDLLGGHLLITGDNLQQNYPLRVLVGSMLRHGQLPFWNQYIFSGTPLMADFNAGAFYPLTGLFAVMPDRAAWIATEVIVYSAIGVGMYVFLRALALSTVACLLGAATFAFAGPVLSQVNHVDMTEGFVAIPWMLLAVLHIVRDGRWRWSVLLGIAFATVILAGAPEAMLDEALLIVAFAVMSAGLSRERWWRVLSRCAAGAVLALSLAAIQWLPGLEAIRSSQRGSGVIAAAGSYPGPFGIFALVPYLDGGYGHLGEAQFFSQYNLPEVGIYLGILPLIALVTLLRPGWPSRIRARATGSRGTSSGCSASCSPSGSNTPLEHLFNALPLYGHQRLQSRNMVTVATAVCVLFAGWIDRTDTPRPKSPLNRYDRIMALVPFGIVAALSIWAQVATGSLVRVFAGVSASPEVTVTVREASIIALAFCAGAAAVVWIRPYIRRLHWVQLAAVFVAIDLGVMAGTSQLTQVPPNDLVSGTTPVQQLMAAHLAPGGAHGQLRPPDLRQLARQPSGCAGPQHRRRAALGLRLRVHRQRQLRVGHPHPRAGRPRHRPAGVGHAWTGSTSARSSPCPSTSSYRSSPCPRSVGDIRQLSEGIGADPVLPRGYGADYNETAYPFYPAPRPALRTGQTASWFFGESLQPDSVTLLLTHAAGPGTVVRFGALGADGQTHWGDPVPVAEGSQSVTGRLPGGSAVGASVRVDAGSLPPYVGIVTVAGRPYELGGALSADDRARTVEPGRLVAGLRGVHPAQTTHADLGHHGRGPATAGRGHLEHDEVRGDPRRRADRGDGPPLRRLGLGMEGLRLRQRGQGAQHPAQFGRPGPGGPHPARTRPRHVPLRAAAPAAGEHPQPRRLRFLGRPSRRVARAPAAVGGRGRGP